MNRRRVWLLVFLLFPLLSTAALTLTLDEAVRLALDQSLSVKKSSIDLAEAGYSARRLWSEIFPGFNLSAGLNFLPATPLLTGGGFQYNDDALSYSLNFALSLSLNPSFVSSMRRIELAYRSQLLSYENAVSQLEIQVIKMFLGLITMQENISYMQESLDLAVQKLNSDRIARQNGLLSELAWLNSQLSAETARYNLHTAQGAYQNALGEFLALLGIDTGTHIIFDDIIEIAPVNLDPEQLILDYLPKRPDIVNQRQIIERLELTRRISSHASRSPTLELGSQWRGSPESSTLNGPFSDSLTGSVTLRIPIDSWIPGTRQSQAVRAANTELEKAKLDLLDTETQAKTQIRSLISNLHSTWESIGIARLRVQVAERTVEATAVGFNNGTVEFRELEDRRNDLSDARQRLLQGELSYKSLLLDLAAALNVEWRLLIRQLTSELDRSVL